MAEEPTADEGAATEPDEQATETPSLGDAGKKALQEERRKARTAQKQLDEAMARLKEYEDRDKTELEKLTEAHKSAEQRAATAEAALIRYRVAAAKNVPADLVDRLRGSTEKELAEDADRLLALIGGTTRPTNFDGGARATASKPADMNALIRRQAGLG